MRGLADHLAHPLHHEPALVRASGHDPFIVRSHHHMEQVRDLDGVAALLFVE
jgi:hypothetical protein